MVQLEYDYISFIHVAKLILLHVITTLTVTSKENPNQRKDKMAIRPITLLSFACPRKNNALQKLLTFTWPHYSLQHFLFVRNSSIPYSAVRSPFVNTSVRLRNDIDVMQTV